MPRDAVLAGLADRLHMPAERRLAVIEEVRADREALAYELEQRGIAKPMARRIADQRVVPDPAACSELARSYAPALKRWLPPAVARPERLTKVLAATLIGLAAIPLAGIWTIGILPGRNPLLWVLAGVAVLLLMNWSRGAALICLEDDLAADTRSVLRGRHAGLLLTGLSAGAIGTALEIYRVLGLGRAEPTGMQVWGALARVATMGAIVAGTAAAGLILWLLLTPKIDSYERIDRRLRSMLDEEPRATRG